MKDSAVANLFRQPMSSMSEPVPQFWIAEIFARLSGMFGSKLGEMFVGSDPLTVQKQWGAGLAGFMPEEVGRGLHRCTEVRFVPALGEFAQFCRPALDPEYAWIEAERGLKARDRGELGVWSHPAVYRATMDLSFEFRRGSFASLRKRWEFALKEEFAHGWGDDVPPVPQRVEHRETRTGMPDSVRKQLAQTISMFRGRAS